MPEKKKKCGIICKKENFEKIKNFYGGWANNYEIIFIDVDELKSGLNIDRLVIEEPS